jgi:hypothetical protein
MEPPERGDMAGGRRSPAGGARQGPVGEADSDQNQDRGGSPRKFMLSFNSKNAGVIALTGTRLMKTPPLKGPMALMPSSYQLKVRAEQKKPK